MLLLALPFLAVLMGGCGQGSSGSSNESKAITYIEANGDYNTESKVWSFPKGVSKSSSETITLDTTTKQFTISVFKYQNLLNVQETTLSAKFTWDNYKNSDFNFTHSISSTASVTASGIYVAKVTVGKYTEPGTIGNVTFTPVVDTLPSGTQLSGWENTAVTDYNNLVAKYCGTAFPSLL